MALTDRDFELLDDYLSNRMDVSEKAAFEERLNQDITLSEELKLQQSLVEGIRQARVTELKSLLNSIPVTSVPPSQTALLTKIGGWAVVTGLIATATYFVFKNNGEPVSQALTVVPTEQPVTEPVQEQATESTTVDEAAEIVTKNTDAAKPGKSATKNESPSVKPTIEAYDPSAEGLNDVQEYEREQMELISNAFVTSSMEVETYRGDKKYNFHYVFQNDKLVLYGAFEKHLYEILEFISGDKKTVVLYYRTNYYLLDVSKDTPTALVPVQNKELLNMLKEHRGK